MAQRLVLDFNQLQCSRPIPIPPTMAHRFADKRALSVACRNMMVQAATTANGRSVLNLFAFTPARPRDASARSCHSFFPPWP